MARKGEKGKKGFAKVLVSSKRRFTFRKGKDKSSKSSVAAPAPPPPPQLQTNTDTIQLLVGGASEPAQINHNSSLDSAVRPYLARASKVGGGVQFNVWNPSAMMKAMVITMVGVSRCSLANN